VYGSIALVGAFQLNVLVFVCIAFLSNTGREITKGIADVQGDKTQNVKTLAVRYGERAAAVVAGVFYFAAVGVSPIPWLLGIVSSWFVPFVVLTDAGLAASSMMLMRDYSRENARRIKNMMLLWLFTGLLAFVAGALG
jgi:geranylgeranylglycerol-phosphate geranylgeranyltransferase